MPFILGAGYCVLLIAHLPQLIRWLTADGDFASAYVLADTVSAGHTGVVVMGTQGAWVSLWYGMLTHGLPFHRALWEISPALVTLASALMVGLCVARLAGRRAGAVAVALLVAASPTGLASFLAPWEHNSTLLCTALLDGFLVWLFTGHRGSRMVLLLAAGLSVLVGASLASDALLWTEGLAPFVLAALAVCLPVWDRRRLAVILGVALVSSLIALSTSVIMHLLGFRTISPPLHLTMHGVLTRVGWLGQGLLRIGNGLPVGPQEGVRVVLTFAAGVTAAAALVTMVLVTRRTRRAAIARPERAIHVTFWFAALGCAALSYVCTALVPSDRYVLVAMPAVAATVPLLMTGRRASRAVLAGAAVFITANLVALTAGDTRMLNPHAPALSQLAAIRRVVLEYHLGVGYADYWNAAPLQWQSDGTLRVHPIMSAGRSTQPAGVGNAASWYRPTDPHPSYVVLTPGNPLLPDRIPAGLPRPAARYQVGTVTIAAYSVDVARYFRLSAR